MTRSGGSTWQGASISRRRVLGAVGAGVSALWLAACGGGANTGGGNAPPSAAGSNAPAATQVTRRRGGTLRLGYPNEIARLSPRGASGGDSLNYHLVMGDSYIHITSTGALDPAQSLFETHEYADPSTFVGRLRKGVTFHDGTPLNAAAVKAHLEFVADKKKAPFFSFTSLLENLAAVETPDEGTVRLKLKSPDATFLSNLGIVAGVPLSIAQVQKLGDDEFVRPACTGPYKVESYTSGTGFSFVKNDAYWGPKDGMPYLDKLDYRVLTQPEGMAAALEAGDLDAGWFFTSNDTTLRLSKDKNLQQAPLTVAPYTLAIDHNKPPLDNLKVRQALASGLDRAKVLTAVNKGQGKVSLTGILPPGTYGAVEYEPYPLNVEKAKQYLRESGVTTPVSLRYIYSGSTDSDDVVAAQIYQETLKQIGFDIKIENVPASGSGASAFYDLDEAHLTVGSTGVRPDPAVQYALYASTYGSLNAGRKSKDPAQLKIDELITKAQQEFDTNKRADVYKELDKLMKDNVLGRIQIVTRVRWLFARKNVGGMDSPEVVNAPTGAGFRARFLSLTS
ncbi:MAG: ABC transporter substrate-binding protein [Dehalococcoidia bacterium]